VIRSKNICVLLLLLLASTILFIGCGSEPIPYNGEDDDDTEKLLILENCNTPVPMSKGAVIGYAAGWKKAPTDKQLEMLTHVMVFQIHPNADGSLDKKALASWLNADFMERAHSKNVKVSVAIGGWVNDGENKSPQSAFWVSATNAENRVKFANNIIRFVDSLKLDGIDIDWEYPQGEEGWNQFIALVSDLKTAMPCKRISAALSGATPGQKNFPGDVQSKIWGAMDAIQLMSYDMCNWETHSDAAASKQLIDDWANWGQGEKKFDKRKLVLGCAFYPRTCGSISSPGDTPESLKEKVNHCYDNGYGGVMIWELSQDLPNNTLLTAIYDATQSKGGYKE